MTSNPVPKTEDWSAYDGAGTMTRARRRSLILLALGLFIDGYDLLAIGSVLLFLKPYFHMGSGEVSLVSFIGFLGAAIGMIVVGDFADRYGRRTVFVINLFAFVVFAVITAFVTNVAELMVLRFLMGLAVGADAPTTMSYIAEVAPAETRGFWLGGVTQVFWVCGALLSTLVAIASWHLFGNDAWRMVFGFGAVPALVVVVLRQGVPESPRWLARQGRAQDARASLGKLGLPDQSVANLAEVGEAGSYRDVFGRANRARLALATSIFALIGISGGVTTVAAPLVFHYFGLLGVAGSLESSLLVWVVALIGTLITVRLFDRFGRMLIGTVATLVTTVALLGMGLFGKGDLPVLLTTYFGVALANWAGSGVWWTLSAELFPTAIRGRSEGIANGACRLTVGADVYLITAGAAALGFGDLLVVFAISPLAMAVILWSSRRWEPRLKSLEVAAGEALDEGSGIGPGPSGTPPLPRQGRTKRVGS